MKFNKETLVDIIEVFEDYLDEKGVKTDNSEGDGEYEDNTALIYGEEFWGLMDKLYNLFECCGIHVPDAYDNDIIPPEPVNDLVIYIPAYDDVIRIDEGTGFNALDEDREAGIVDYMQYYVYDAEDVATDMKDNDGGMLTSKEYIRDKYKSMRDAVPEVLKMVYGTDQLTWVVISGGADFEENKQDPEQPKLYRVSWVYGNPHYCYVKAYSKSQAEHIVKHDMREHIRLTDVVEAEEHQIASRYDICVNFRNPRLDEDKLCG